jgi:hypothetical protein
MELARRCRKLYFKKSQYLWLQSRYQSALFLKKAPLIEMGILTEIFSPPA